METITRSWEFGDSKAWRWSKDKTWATKELLDGRWVAATKGRILHLEGTYHEYAHGPTRDDAVFNFGYQMRDLEDQP